MYSPVEKIQVVGALLIKGDQILVGKRKVGDSGAGHWEFPGGKVEPGESLEEALQREIKEELDISIKVMKMISSQETQTITGKTIQLSLFAAQIRDAKIKMNEHDELRWIKASELSQLNFLPGNRKFIPFVETYLKNQSKK